MKTFETPAIEVAVFSVEDIVTVSSDFVPPDQKENQTIYG